MRKYSILIPALLLFFIAGCGIYSFTGSSLPKHLRTVMIQQFLNQSLEPNVAEEVTQRISQEILTGNLLRIVNENGDATIQGKIISYSNNPYTFSALETKQINVNQYIVRIVADVEFMDNTKNEPLYKGSITGEGVYDFGSQTEQDGKIKAIRQLVEKVMQNSVQGW